jgi:hypothetical protein
MEKKQIGKSYFLGIIVLLVLFFPPTICVESSVLDRSLNSCVQIWTELDLLRAIRYSPDQHKALLEKTMEEILLLYQPLVTLLPVVSNAQSDDSVNSLCEICDAIGLSLEELYQKTTPHKQVYEDHMCMQVVLKRIMNRLKSSLARVNN